MMIAAAAGVALLSITVAVLGLRLAGAKVDAADADRIMVDTVKRMGRLAGDFDDYKQRAVKQLADLRADIRGLEGDLALCSGPGAVRNRLERLLQKAADREHHTNPPQLSGRGGSGP